MAKNNNFSSFLKTLGYGKESTPLKDIEVSSKVYVPFEAFYILNEETPQGQTYLLLLDLNFKKYSKKKDERYYNVLIYKKSKSEYVIIEPFNNLMEKIQKKTKELSQEYLQFITENLPRKNIIKVPFPYNEETTRERKKIYDEYLTKGYTKVAGRELTSLEKDKTLLSIGEFTPEKLKQANPKEIMDYLNSQLILQRETKKQLFNSLSIHDIIMGKTPANNGVVLFGPGGTGKSTILKTLMEIFENNMGAYVAKNENNQILKTSEVGDTRYVGAFQDYFTPIFNNAIERARQNGIPSLICIDEGDIFVEKSDISQNPHGPDVINFFKAYAGNIPEIILCIATNVLKENLDPIATRAGRIATIEIPYPNKEIANYLIKYFIDYYKININPPLSEEQINELANFIVENNKPGANIGEFCKNFYSLTIDISEEYSKGKSPEEVEEMINNQKNYPVSPEEFIRRFMQETIEVAEESKPLTIQKNLDQIIEEEEENSEYLNNLIKNKIISNLENSLNFTQELREFYERKKIECQSNTNYNEEDKIKIYNLLIYMINKIIEYSHKKQKVLEELNDPKTYGNFLENLYNKIKEENLTKEKDFIKFFNEQIKKHKNNKYKKSKSKTSRLDKLEKKEKEEIKSQYDIFLQYTHNFLDHNQEQEEKFLENYEIIINNFRQKLEEKNLKTDIISQLLTLLMNAISFDKEGNNKESINIKKAVTNKQLPYLETFEKFTQNYIDNPKS